MSRRKQLQPIRAGAGAGEGRFSADPLSIDMSSREIRVDLSKLPAPSNVYDADVWSLRREAGFVSIYFGQLESAAGTTLRSRLRLKYPIERFVDGFVKGSANFRAGLDKMLSQLPDEPLLPAPRDISTEPVSREHSAWTNFDYLSRSGTQAAFDFYNLPTAGLARFVQHQGTNGLVLEPVVRVTTSVYVMGQVLAAAVPVAEAGQRFASAEALVDPGAAQETVDAEVRQ